MTHTFVSIDRVASAGRSLLTLNRDREYAILKSLLSLRPTNSVLDVGSGDGFWTARFARNCARITGIEPGNEALKHARELHQSSNVTYVRGIAESLPFPDAVFDKVVSISCVEHFADPGKGLLEMARVLRPGGRLAISVDSLLAENSPKSFRDWHMKRHYVTRYFRESELRDMVIAAGLSPDGNVVHLLRSRVAASLRQVFIRRPLACLPLFPLFYSVVRLSDRLANDFHGQILIAAAIR